MGKYSFCSIIILILTFKMTALSQNPLSQTTQVEVGLGFTMPNLYSGIELLRSQQLRNKGLSYYSNKDGDRNSVGSYSNPSGFNLTLAFYKPTELLSGLMIGAIVRNSQTGTLPQISGYEEGYFFNFITANFAAKYYPIQEINLFLKADVGLAAVLTKNRFINSDNQQNFFHQFGIGPNAGAEIGYSFQFFENKFTTIELKFGYQILSTRVEVNDVGNDNWLFGALYLGTSINF